MAEKVTNEQLKTMFESLDKKLDDNTIVLRGVAEEVKNVTKTVAVHEHRIKALEESGSKTHHNVQQWLSILIALGATISAIISMLN